MSAPDQAAEADRAAHHLDRLLTPYIPDVSRWSLCLRIVEDLQAEHWRCIPPPPDAIAVARSAAPATPPTSDYLEAKAAITRKDNPHA